MKRRRKSLKGTPKEHRSAAEAARARFSIQASAFDAQMDGEGSQRAKCRIAFEYLELAAERLGEVKAHERQAKLFGDAERERMNKMRKRFGRECLR